MKAHDKLKKMAAKSSHRKGIAKTHDSEGNHFPRVPIHYTGKSGKKYLVGHREYTSDSTGGKYGHFAGYSWRKSAVKKFKNDS